MPKTEEEKNNNNDYKIEILNICYYSGQPSESNWAGPYPNEDEFHYPSGLNLKIRT